MRKLFAYLLQIAPIIIVGLFLISAIFHPGWYASHDGIFHIYRTEEALNMLKLGQFPLRWAGNFDQGFGIPLFTFIYPLPYYLSAVFSYLVGPIWSLKSVIILAYLFGGLGIYQLFARKDRLIALTLALVYLMTPYQFLNIFVRGAIGEILALGIMPWVLVSFSSLIDPKTKTLQWYHPIPFGLLLIAHNFLGILFGIFLLGYVVTQHGIKKPAIQSFFLSLGLASFFLLPMIFEKNLLFSTVHPDLNFRYDQHFATFKQLLYGKWDYWYSVPGDNDGMSFQLGLVPIILSGIGILYLLLKRLSLSSFYLIVAYLGSILLMTERSNFIWQFVPILKSIQFPWRFLFMPAILTPLLAFPYLSKIKFKYLKYAVLLGILLLLFVNVRNYRRPIKFLELTEYTDLYRLYLNKTSTTFRSEVLPMWNVANERFKSEDILVNAGNMTIDSFVATPLKLETTINNKPDQSQGRVTILRNYFPSWSATMDGTKKIALTPTSEGMITLMPELGIHHYVIKVTSTLLEKIANALSAVSLILLGLIWQKSRK